MTNKLKTLKTLIESQTKTQNALLFYYDYLKSLDKLFNIYTQCKCLQSIVNTRLQEINTHKQIDRLFNNLDNINKQILTFKN